MVNLTAGVVEMVWLIGLFAMFVSVALQVPAVRIRRRARKIAPAIRQGNSP